MLNHYVLEITTRAIKAQGRVSLGMHDFFLPGITDDNRGDYAVKLLCATVSGFRGYVFSTSGDNGG